jgi:hypothetical protein
MDGTAEADIVAIQMDPQLGDDDRTLKQRVIDTLNDPQTWKEAGIFFLGLGLGAAIKWGVDKLINWARNRGRN